MKKIITIFGVVLMFVGFAPLVPQDMEWQSAYTRNCIIHTPSLVSSTSTIPAKTESYREDCIQDEEIAIAVFIDKKGNRVDVEITLEQYKKMGEVGGVQFNPKENEYISLFEQLIPEAEASIATDAESWSTINSSVTSATFSHTNTGDDGILLVAVYTDTSSTQPTGITYDGSGMTSAIQRDDNNSSARLSMWFITAPSTGANNIVVTVGVTGTIIAFGSSYTGAKQSAQPDSTVSNGADTITSLAFDFTTVADNSWTVLFPTNQTAATLSSVTNGTKRSTGSDGWRANGIYDSNADITPAGAFTMTANYSGSTNIEGVGVSISPAVAGVGEEFNNSQWF